MYSRLEKSFCAFFTQPVKYGPQRIDRKLVIFLNMGAYFVEDAAVQVKQFAAFFALEVKVFAAYLSFFYILVTGAFFTFKKIAANLSRFDQFFQVTVNRRLADYRLDSAEVSGNGPGGDMLVSQSCQVGEYLVPLTCLVASPAAGVCVLFCLPHNNILAGTLYFVNMKTGFVFILTLIFVFGYYACMELFRCEDIGFSYDGRPAVRDLNFSVEAGEKLCIIGENGAGKTTLLKGLLGLINPDEGRIIRSRELKAGGIGYLPQESPLQKDFPAIAGEVVLSGCQGRRDWWPFYTKADKAAARSNLERVGLADQSRSFRDLSGGQRRRALLARALCAAGVGYTHKENACGVLLLDEPASGLDPLVQKELYATLRSINAELSITIIMVSHDITGALDMADKVLHLGEKPPAEGGTSLYFGSSQNYRDSEAGQRFLNGQRRL
jgi:zinc transport system ATP-binding protein